MRASPLMRAILFGFLVLFTAVHSVAAQSKPPQATVPVTMTVTLLKAHEGPEPTLYKEDVVASQGSKRLQVASWIPAQGSKGGIQLMILLDDTIRGDLSAQMRELHAFVEQRPSTTAIEFGYVYDGSVELSQELRAPTGRTASSYPYASLAMVCDHWTFDPAYPRHEVLLISDGAISGGETHEREGSRAGGTAVIGDPNPNIVGITARLQADGVQVYAINMHDLASHPERPDPQRYGVSALTTISEQGGGEPLYLGLNVPLSQAPHLEQLTRILARQYLLTVLMPQKRDGGFQQVKLSTEVANAKFEFAGQVWVPGVLH